MGKCAAWGRHGITHHFPSSVYETLVGFGETKGSDTLTCMPDKLSLRSWTSLQETEASIRWWKGSRDGYVAWPLRLGDKGKIGKDVKGARTGA